MIRLLLKRFRFEYEEIHTRIGEWLVYSAEADLKKSYLR